MILKISVKIRKNLSSYLEKETKAKFLNPFFKVYILNRNDFDSCFNLCRSMIKINYVAI